MCQEDQKKMKEGKWKKIDIQLKRKQEQSRIGGGYFRNLVTKYHREPKIRNKRTETTITKTQNRPHHQVRIKP